MVIGTIALCYVSVMQQYIFQQSSWFAELTHRLEAGSQQNAALSTKYKCWHEAW